jgi:hypothetical protein
MQCADLHYAGQSQEQMPYTQLKLIAGREENTHAYHGTPIVDCAFRRFAPAARERPQIGISECALIHLFDV